MSEAEVAAIFSACELVCLCQNLGHSSALPGDTNKDGVLSLEEVLEGLKQLKLPCTPTDVAYYRERFQAYDTNRSGGLSRAELTLPDFMALVREKETGLRAVFDALDADHSGFLDFAELQRALQSLNVPYDDRAVGRLYRHMDKNGDGKITFAEFREVLLLVPDYSLASVMECEALSLLPLCSAEGRPQTGSRRRCST